MLKLDVSDIHLTVLGSDARRHSNSLTQPAQIPPVPCTLEVVAEVIRIALCLLISPVDILPDMRSMFRVVEQEQDLFAGIMKLFDCGDIVIVAVIVKRKQNRVQLFPNCLLSLVSLWIVLGKCNGIQCNT